MGFSVLTFAIWEIDFLFCLRCLFIAQTSSLMRQCCVSISCFLVVSICWFTNRNILMMILLTYLRGYSYRAFWIFAFQSVETAIARCILSFQIIFIVTENNLCKLMIIIYHEWKLNVAILENPFLNFNPQWRNEIIQQQLRFMSSMKNLYMIKNEGIPFMGEKKSHEVRGWCSIIALMLNNERKANDFLSLNKSMRLIVVLLRFTSQVSSQFEQQYKIIVIAMDSWHGIPNNRNKLTENYSFWIG